MKNILSENVRIILKEFYKLSESNKSYMMSIY